MKRVYSARFQKSFDEAPKAVQKACDKQLNFLLQNLHHPSLRAKKYDEGQDLWQARVNKGWRFYFFIQGDANYLVDIVPHKKNNHRSQSCSATMPNSTPPSPARSATGRFPAKPGSMTTWRSGACPGIGPYCKSLCRT
jgi:mRNA interferase RelE/StbE